VSEIYSAEMQSTSQESSFAGSSHFASSHGAEEEMRTFNRERQQLGTVLLQSCQLP